MKNVKNSVKFRRFLKSMAINVFLLALFVASSAFKSFSYTDRLAGGETKPAATKGGFKSLFPDSYFDPSKPYVTQINPKAIAFVQNYLKTNGEELERMKVWGKPYFEMYDGILAQYGLPVELKYLSVIESSLVPHVVSSAGAVGPWQIMAQEARSRGLKITKHVDERTNFYKSTHAAAKILKSLNKQFSDWLLVIAAYNCGAGRLRQAIRKSGSKDFWDLQKYLPAETRNHVKRFIATHYLFEGSGGLTTMTAAEVLDFDNQNGEGVENSNNYTSVEVSGKYNSDVVARTLSIGNDEFDALNPNFDRLVSSGEGYKLKLPIDKLQLFNIKKHEILNESVQVYLNN